MSLNRSSDVLTLKSGFLTKVRIAFTIHTKADFQYACMPVVCEGQFIFLHIRKSMGRHIRIQQKASVHLSSPIAWHGIKNTMKGMDRLLNLKKVKKKKKKMEEWKQIALWRLCVQNRFSRSLSKMTFPRPTQGRDPPLQCFERVVISDVTSGRDCHCDRCHPLTRLCAQCP